MTNKTKAAVEEAAKNLIKGLKIKVSHCDSDDNDVSWGMQEGILISKGDAKAIIELMESHTAAHTAALRERVKELEGMLNHVVYEYEQDEQSFKTILEIKEALKNG